MQKCHEIRDSSLGLCHGTGRSTIWLPLDLVLEDALTLTRVVNATSLIEVLTGKAVAILDYSLYTTCSNVHGNEMFVSPQV